MDYKELFTSGKVRETIEALTAHLRERPSDRNERALLFDLLCFAGEYERAKKHLAVLADGGADNERSATLWYSALHAEKSRHELFQNQTFPASVATSSLIGELNGRPFSDIRDADPDIGARMEIFAAGAYLWLPFEHVASVEIAPPTWLRDTLWAPGFIQAAESLRDTDLGEVLVPVIYPFSWKHDNQEVWLGHITTWASDEQCNEYPSGQKILLVDGAEVPFLEVRSIRFFQPPTASSSTAN